MTEFCKLGIAKYLTTNLLLKEGVMSVFFIFYSNTKYFRKIECSLSESSLYLGTDLRHISSPAFFKNEAMHMGFIMRKLANNYGACMDLFQCADPLQPVK